MTLNTTNLGLHNDIQKYMNLDEPYKVKDCLISIYDDIDPSSPEAYECFKNVRDAVLWLYQKGWSVGVVDYGDDRKTQFTCVSPKKEWFHSNYSK